MKISEMTHEELQDYALKLEEDKKTLGERCDLYEKEKSDLLDLNKQLQKRNNELFMKVESQTTPTPTETQETQKPKESLETFAKNLVLNGGF